MKVFAVTLPMPPTSNNIYANAHGKRVMTSEARAWKRRAVSFMVREAGLGLQEGLDPDEKYWLDLHFFFDQVENKGWNERYTRGPKKGQRKCDTRWKKIDLSNRVKLLEDTVKTAVGVDDSSTFVQMLMKDEDKKNPRVEVELHLMDGER